MRYSMVVLLFSRSVECGEFRNRSITPALRQAIQGHRAVRSGGLARLHASIEEAVVRSTGGQYPQKGSPKPTSATFCTGGTVCEAGALKIDDDFFRVSMVVDSLGSLNSLIDRLIAYTYTAPFFCARTRADTLKVLHAVVRAHRAVTAGLEWSLNV